MFLALLSSGAIPVLWIRINFFRPGFESGFSINYGPDSDPALAFISDPDSDPVLALILDPDLGFGSGLFIQKYIRVYLVLPQAQRVLNPYLNCRSSKLRKKLVFLITTFVMRCFCQLETELDFGSGFESESKINYGFGS